MTKHAPINPSRVLTFEEKVVIAHAYHVEHISQQTIATLMRVNQGRVSEVCTAVAAALAPKKVDAEEVTQTELPL